LETEPENFLAAREDGRLVGYAIFVRSLKALQRRAILSGAPLRWALNALAGRYDLRRNALWTILRNKMLFVANGQRYRTRGDAQLLNVAVHPDAQGRGLGGALTLAGLHHLAGRGLAEVVLYVEADNAPAVATYRRLGFEVDAVAVSFGPPADP